MYAKVRPYLLGDSNLDIRLLKRTILKFMDYPFNFPNNLKIVSFF